MQVSLREQQKHHRRERIFSSAMQLFKEQGFQTTTVQDIASAAQVSRGTVFNYYPYKEAILIDYLRLELAAMQERITVLAQDNPLEIIRHIFLELADLAQVNPDLLLPLSYELLNPNPERSRYAYVSLPLVPILHKYISCAKERKLIRQDFSRERLARTLANTFFLTALQWAAYRQDRSIHDELSKALKLTLEGIIIAQRH